MHLCPSCGLDLSKNEPVSSATYKMHGPNGPLVIDGKDIPLAPLENEVAWALLRAKPAPLGKDAILLRIGSEGDGNLVAVILCRLRKKIREAGVEREVIQTVYGGGYRWII